MINIKQKILPFALGIISIAGSACNKTAPVRDESPLARAGNHFLYPSDIKGLVPDGIEGQDSVKMVTVYIENWIQNKLIVDAAERNVNLEGEVDRLVQEYRESLILQKYEVAVLRERLDSNITTLQLQKYYEDNKSQYPLRNDLIRYYMVKMPRSMDGYRTIEKAWKNDEFATIVKFCNEHQDTIKFHLDENAWTDIRKLTDAIPHDISSRYLEGKKDYIKKIDKFRYWFRVLERIDKGEPAPLVHIQKDVSKVIMHKRKLELLDQLQRDVYEKGVSNGKFEIFQN